MSEQNPFLMAANGPELDDRLMPLLRARPTLAAIQDGHGYSLLHAGASYNHPDLLRVLVNEFKVDVNLRDEDGETCLFVAETVDTAKVLIDELHIDVDARNDEDLTAAQKIEAEGDFPELASYLQQHLSGDDGAPAGSLIAQQGGSAKANHSDHPPPLPPNVSLNIGSVTDELPADEADPEFRRRIEELASREDFNTAEGQQELRELITDAVRGVSTGEQDAQRRRVG